MIPFVIAEAGVNHNGSLERALELVSVAAEAGADAVKFQTFDAELLVTREAAKAEYQIANTEAHESQSEMIKALELSHEEFLKVAAHAGAKGIEFMSTAFDMQSLDFLVSEAKVSRIKIPSGEITNGPYLFSCAKKHLPMLMSTGMCTLADIYTALDIIAYAGVVGDEVTRSGQFLDCSRTRAGRAFLESHVTLLHCTTEYPTPDIDANLLAVPSLIREFGLNVGYSDHTAGVLAPALATAVGAVVIEKHLTLDRQLPGPDHAASVEPDELREMIHNVRTAARMLGDGVKMPRASELKNMDIARRSLVALRHIRKGQVFSRENLGCKRPGTGLSPMYFWHVLGTVAERDYVTDELIDEVPDR